MKRLKVLLVLACCVAVGWEASVATGLTLLAGNWLLKGGKHHE